VLVVLCRGYGVSGGNAVNDAVDCGGRSW